MWEVGIEWGEAERFAVVGLEGCGIAVRAMVGCGLDFFLAFVAVAEVVCDAWDILCDGPVLSGGGASHDGIGFDESFGDVVDEDGVGAARAEGVVGIADKPWSHVLLRDLA